MTRGDLRDARSITKDLYELVKAFDARICTQLVHTEFADIVELTAYNRQNLREELNSVVKEKENECWGNPDTPHAYDGDFEKCLIDLCSAFTTQNGESKRNKLMPIICRFESLEYEEKYIPAWKDDPSNFDLYRQIFTSLVENQMMKIDQENKEWTVKHIDDLIAFVENARGDDYKSFCVRYAIYPDMNGCLHTLDDLKRNVKVNDKLFDLFQQVTSEDLKSKCVDKHFELFYDKYSEEIFQCTPYSVANEIQNKLSADNYQDTVLLDIIDLTEQSGKEGIQWKSLFKDIYELRESIRYKLGTDDERKAINRMMKRKSPLLLEMMADVVERKDADKLISALNATIDNMEHEEYIKMLGEFVEKHIEGFLKDALSMIGVTVSNEQGGQDLILRKEGYKEYFVEIKSRWVDKASAIMSQKQFRNAVDNSDRYALISAQMWTFDEERVKANEHIELTEMEPRIRVCDRIGKLETELLKRMDKAFEYDEREISAVGSYDVHTPQKTFNMTFDEFVIGLHRIFA